MSTENGRVIICDPDLHAYLISRWVGEDLHFLEDLAGRLFSPDARLEAARLLNEKNHKFQPREWESLIRGVHNVCPHNFAERLLEALALYRIIGRTALPELIPLSIELLKADLHCYHQPGSKPYRDHLAHQTRVAALSHLFMSSNSQLEPWNKFRDDLLRDWDQSRECVLLHRHLLHLGLKADFFNSGPAPGGESPFSEELGALVRSAMVLAGLIHDIGYLVKVNAAFSGDSERALRRMGVFPEKPGHPDPPDAPITTLFRDFWEQTEAGGAYRTMAGFIRAHPDNPHSFAGAMWLAYLPTRLLDEGGIYKLQKERPESRKAWARFEFICQLAAMMALMHDLPLESKKKQGAQGFKAIDGANGETLLERFPLCGIFALADTLNEFGRPVIYTSSHAMACCCPVIGLDFVWPEEWSSMDASQIDEVKKEGLLSASWEEKPAEKTGMEIFWDVRLPKKQSPKLNTPPRSISCFDEKRLGEDVPPRLEKWGLLNVFSQRNVEAANKIEARDLFGGMRKIFKGKGGALKFHPLEKYDDNYREVRDKLKLTPLW